MLAKDIAETLKDGNWKETDSATLYTNSTSRIRVLIEQYKPNNGGIWIDENEDMVASDADFIETFMNSIGMQLCADQEMKLVKALVTSLKNWSSVSSDNTEMVNNFLKSLIKE